jgi:Na+/H+-translocating membrane pyrophosphatase
MPVTAPAKIESTLKWQLIISSILLTPVIIFLSLYLVPSKITFGFTLAINDHANVYVMISALCGLWAGLIIGYFTDYFTSNTHAPTERLAYSCKSGAAINIINGLALGYLSCIIPIIALAGNFKIFI